MRRAIQPVALTIAGSDSGGGAGLQADLKTFAALGVHGLSVVTCVTAQNPRRVAAIYPLPSRIIRAQLEAVLAEFELGAVKIGMLFSKEAVRATADFLELETTAPVVLDPVLRAGTGAALLEASAFKIFCQQLVPRALLLTPNLAEAEMLSGSRVRSVGGMRRVARELQAEFGCAFLVKGGHLRGGDEAADIFWDGRTELLLSVPRVKGLRTHGTGCTYASAVAAGLAKGLDLTRAVVEAKEFVSQAIAGSRRAGRHGVLGWPGAGQARAVK